MVAAGDAGDPTSVAMMQTAQRALDPNATVLAIETQSPPTDISAESIGRAQHADAIVIVSWSPNHDHARLRVRTSAGTWADREIAFKEADAPEERGRALGLVAATMVPAPSAPPPPAGPPPRPPPMPPPAPVPRVVIDVGAALGVGLNASAVSVGPAALGSIRLVGRIWGHLGAQIRFGPYDPARATATWFVVGPGIGARVPVAGDFWLGGRAHLEVLGVYLSGEGSAAGRATLGIAALLEGGWQSGGFGVRLGTGVETAFERTNVIVGVGSVGHLPTWRLRAELAGSVAF